MKLTRKHLTLLAGTAAVAGAVASAVIATPQASFAWPPVGARASWSEIDRKPNFDTHSRPGFYVWRDRDYIYVVSNDRNRTRPSLYTGTVSVQRGALSNVGGYETEPNDRIQQVGRNRVNFALRTDTGLDGVKFRVDGGDAVRLDLRVNGRRTDHVYLGQYKVQANRDPVIVRK